MQEIWQSATGISILCGPFLDKTDGITPKNGVDLTTADSAIIIKHGCSASLAITSATWTHIESGWYALAATSTMFDTLGQCTIRIHDVSLCLPFWKDFMVKPTTVWNFNYGANPLTVASVSNSIGVVTTLSSISTGATLASVSGSVYNLANNIWNKVTYYPSQTVGDWTISSVTGSVYSLANNIWNKVTYYPSQTVGDWTIASVTGSVYMMVYQTYIKLPTKSYLTGTTQMTGDIDADDMVGDYPGNLTGTLASCSQLGAFTGAVASVSVVGTVASVSIVGGFGTGVVTASAFAAGVLATAAEVASVTWDTTCTAHGVTTSYGLRLGGAPTATTMASDIIAIMAAGGGNPWDVTVTAHTATNSYGLILGGIPSATTLATDINGIAGKAAYLPSITMGSWSISMVASVSGSVFDAATKINTYYPSVTAGSAGGVFIAGTNAQTTVNLVSSITGNQTGSITGNLTGSITGNLTGTLASVSGSVYDAATKINTYYPSVSAGSAGGVFIAGTNALTTVNLTSSITGNQTGSITGNLTGSITGNLTGNVTGNLTGNIVGIVGDVSASALDAIWDEVVDGTTVTARDSFKIANSFMAGEVSGGGTASITFRDLDNALDRIILTVDASGNRASSTVNI
jgi:hypothetical protein